MVVIEKALWIAAWDVLILTTMRPRGASRPPAQPLHRVITLGVAAFNGKQMSLAFLAGRKFATSFPLAFCGFSVALKNIPGHLSGLGKARATISSGNCTGGIFSALVCDHFGRLETLALWLYRIGNLFVAVALRLVHQSWLPCNKL